MIKHFLGAILCPTLLFGQSMELTQQLGKTVLYGGIALSPDDRTLVVTNVKQISAIAYASYAINKC